ncbi:uncharacterized protein LOC131015913 [Salvia miltiorrhiza]|uniref:uncharacterized protein LOC131015913 n=1 Tax=Salvia miltiorrhiza TaxID=226208 RepID=UPI0025AC357A|nr:uncharacterized protein LOC131015913 [Salvia miltiorrhiza]
MESQAATIFKKLGAAVNLMPFDIFKKLGRKEEELKCTNTRLQLADGAISSTRGLLEDIEVTVRGITVLADFVVLEAGQALTSPALNSAPALNSICQDFAEANLMSTRPEEDEIIQDFLDNLQDDEAIEDEFLAKLPLNVNAVKELPTTLKEETEVEEERADVLKGKEEIVQRVQILLINFPTMPLPNETVISSTVNLLILEETSYNIEEINAEHHKLYHSLTDEQNIVYEKIMTAVDSGRTAHSRFGIPLDCDENSTCHKIKPDSDLTVLLKKTKLISWDEAPMTHRYCFEVLDRSLKDVMRSPEGSCYVKPFGGLVVGGASASDVEDIKKFVEWILSIGDGTTGESIGDGEADLRLPDDMIIRDSSNPIASIVKSTYLNVLHTLPNPEYFKDRAILAPTNDMVDSINEYVMSLMPAKERVYLISVNICKDDGEVDLDDEVFSVEYLNTIKCSGLPSHEIKLKEGCIIMLLRNIGPSNELCNGTRMIVTKLGARVIEAKLISGNNAGKKFPIARMVMSPSDFTKFPIRF